MNISVTIRGADDLDRKLAAAPDGAQRVIDAGNAAAAPVLKQSINRETPVRTGALVRSEDVLVKGSDLEFQAMEQYASYVAYGTSRQRANPYPDRGVNNAEVEVVREFEAAAAGFVVEFGR